MIRRNKVKSSTKVSVNRNSKKSIESSSSSLSTLHILSYAEYFFTLLFTHSTGRSKRVSSRVLSAAEKYKLTAERPENIATKPSTYVAAHFGNFYDLRDNAGRTCRDNRRRNFLGAERTIATNGDRRRRSEFTRQMVRKLERASDIEDYARQVSALLKETVEPPNFRLDPFLSENSIPNGSRRIPDYPLWYKEPHDIPLVFSNSTAQLDTNSRDEVH
ncbi:PREDICTED: uncharacterized protein LOC106750319 [Dinoponera quadriceps]|uniref:Uncharacterized protein LOC106750319 n=1 Tax=Dinoponera quadriceps TaxID=609295 RepID=A0A6P3Y5B8_DINQU|nr:PREDICTED: uncharacterized protein LOC106750319 [Dinoponera quadriceps]